MTYRANLLRLGVVVVWLLVLGTGCSGAGAGQPPLDGTTWTLTSWAEPDPIPTGVAITAEFADGRVAGSSGVNRYTAAVSSNPDGTFSVDQPASTMMAGPPDAMAAEAAYLRRLEAATSYRVDDDTLVINDADGQTSLTFTRA